MIDQAVASLYDYGVCLESLWPYDLSRVNMQPSAQAYQTAQNYKVTDWLQLEIDLNEMKLSLAQGYPFTFGVELFNSFGMATKGGVVPMPSAAERNPSHAWDPSRQRQQHRYDMIVSKMSMLP